MYVAVFFGSGKCGYLASWTNPGTHSALYLISHYGQIEKSLCLIELKNLFIYYSKSQIKFGKNTY